MTVWFTADHHFGHKNIIKYCQRPFDSVEDMDNELIKRWNMYIMSDDTVYHLGDFTLEDYDNWRIYASRLNGYINIVPGSHDFRWLKNYVVNKKLNLAGITIEDALITIEESGQIIVLCHYAMRVWDRSHYNSWQLYGHSHGMLEPQGKQMDVGVDNIARLYGEYRPVSYEEVKAYMLKRPDNMNLVKKEAQHGR